MLLVLSFLFLSIFNSLSLHFSSKVRHPCVHTPDAATRGSQTKINSLSCQYFLQHSAFRPTLCLSTSKKELLFRKRNFTAINRNGTENSAFPHRHFSCNLQPYKSTTRPGLRKPPISSQSGCVLALERHLQKTFILEEHPRAKVAGEKLCQNNKRRGKGGTATQKR